MAVLITGASGNLGATVARGLARAGHPTVLGTRTPNPLAAPGVEHSDLRHLDFDDPATFRTALRGVAALLLRDLTGRAPRSLEAVPGSGPGLLKPPQPLDQPAARYSVRVVRSGPRS